MLENYFILLTVYSVVHCYPLQQNILTDGWIPMSHDVVHNQIRRQWPPLHSVYTSVKLPELLPSTTLSENNQNEISSQNDHINVATKENEIIMDKNEVSKNVKKRSGRKMINNSFNYAIEENGDFYNTDYKNTSIDNKETDVQASDKYDVTENTELYNEDISPKEAIGYQYTPPIAPIKEANNLTARFLQILAKYNITPEDKLPNYNLSRKFKSENTITRPNFPFAYKYNSLNHLPVDPLFAVFLSNYGFYLPNLYGIKSNYNNLYGYLASNNIHNNKPFGLYKIYSDTDSAN